MPKFISSNYDQDAMVVLNFKEQLQPGTFEYAVHYLIDHKLDLSVFHPHYKNDDNGRPAYDPAMLLKIILFAYSKGITSSREIQWCCETNVIFKALTCDKVPHFTTIAAFASGYPDEIEKIFEQVLLICSQQGLLGNELFAIDGCKLPSNASKEWVASDSCPHATLVPPCTSSGTFKELEQKRDKIKRQIRYYLGEHQQHDKNESRDEARQQRVKQTIDTLNSSFDKIDQFLQSSKPKMGQGKRPKEVKSNITDNIPAIAPALRAYNTSLYIKMKTSKGTIQGYNGVAAVDKKHQIIVDAQAFGEGQEQHLLEPVLTKIQERLKRLRIHPSIYKKGVLVTADTGYANESNMRYLHQNQINAYIPDNQFRQRDARFQHQKTKYGKRQQYLNQKSKPLEVPPTEFQLDEKTETCRCPKGHLMWLKNKSRDPYGNDKLFFEGRLTKCRACPIKTKCMRNPRSADTRRGHGRQVSFIIKRNKRPPNYTDWMKQRIDSDEGKHIYSHRLSVVGNLMLLHKLYFRHPWRSAGVCEYNHQ